MMPALKDLLSVKVVMVTGAGGSIGSEMCRQIARFAPSKLVLFESNEYAMCTIEQELKLIFPLLNFVSLIKKRKSYWKRSRISGKMKMKPEKFKGTEHDLKVRIVANPEFYTISRTSPTFKQGLNIGKYTISQLSTEGGMISFVANSPFEEVEHENIVLVLQSAFSLLQRKAV